MTTGPDTPQRAGTTRSTDGPAGAWWPAASALFTVGWGANSFPPLLGVYRTDLGLSTASVTTLFALYAVGLVPALLLAGPASDRWGRRPLAVPAVVLAAVATAVTAAGAGWPPALAVGRLLTGIAAGVVFAAGAAWVGDLSAGAGPGAGARRTGVALSAGFGAGPVVAALVATWAPFPLLLPYLPHLVLTCAALVWLRTAPDPHATLRVTSTPRGCGRLVPGAVRTRPFRTTVAPMAPWVFGCATTAFAALPVLVGGIGVAGAGLLTALTLGVGTAVQPLVRRLGPARSGVVGLLTAAAGLGTGAAATAVPALVIAAAVLLGAAYGLCLTAGLRSTEALAGPTEPGTANAVFLALTYLGFAAPLALTATATGPVAALPAAAALAALTAAWIAVAPRHVRTPTRRTR